MEINEIENYFTNANEINISKDFSSINLDNLKNFE